MRERELGFRGGCRVGLGADMLVLDPDPLLLLFLLRFLVGGEEGDGVGKGVSVSVGEKGQVVRCRHR
jgi:hypothetical protein